MDFQALVRSRRSARGFRNEAVQKTVIREIIEDAKRAPSSMNSQPYDEAIMTCITMGYPDEAFPANAVCSERTPADAFVRSVGFAEG